jgi:hypothetical protein
MPIKLKDILKDPQEDDYWEEFFKVANTGVTAQINATRVASEIYLAKMLKTTGILIKEEVYNSGNKTQKALSEHAAALNKSAIAANKHARGLKWATWALVFATFGLILVTILTGYK